MAKRSWRKGKTRGSKPRSPDEVVQIGPIVLARTGRFVTMKNVLSVAGAEALQHELALKYPEVCGAIDARVTRIQGFLRSWDPLSVLRNGYFFGATRMLGKTSEIHYSSDDVAIVPMVEYVQSIFVAQPPTSPLEHPSSDQWEELRREVTDLYHEVTQNHAIVRTAFLRALGGYDEALDAFLVRAEMLWVNVRCHRYPGHDLLSIGELLGPHDDVLRDVFGLAVDDLVASLVKARDSLTVVPLEILRDAREQSGGDPARFWNLVMRSPLGSADLFDVGRTTGLPDSFLRELAWEPGEETKFLDADSFRGWPILTLPVQQRPFLKVGGRYYCFSHVSLMDNAYRLLQRTICRLRPEYREEWNRRQKVVSEASATAFFQRLLPGARSLANIYYPIAGRSQRGETDALIIWDDHLIIVEVKAGAFAPGPPAQDASAQLVSIAELLAKPAGQAHRFLEYLESAPEVPFYDEQNNRIGALRRSDFRVVTCCAVTLDQLTSLACQVEWLDEVGVQVRDKPLWAVSLDDLRVYSEIMDVPVMFTHFLEERRRAFESPLIKLDDELDHLGLYLKHGRYVTHAERVAPQDALTWTGYREEIDTYFYNLDAAPDEAKKPKQAMPVRMDEILRKISTSDSATRCRVGGRLLELDSTGREEFARNLEESIDRCLAGAGPRSSWLIGGVRMMVLCSLNSTTPATSILRDYLAGMLLRVGEQEGLLLRVVPDQNREITSLEMVRIDIGGVDLIERQRIEVFARQEALRRVERRLARGPLGRNETCACCSGRKFKRCCQDLWERARRENQKSSVESHSAG